MRERRKRRTCGKKEEIMREWEKEGSGERKRKGREKDQKMTPVLRRKEKPKRRGGKCRGEEEKEV